MGKRVKQLVRFYIYWNCWGFFSRRWLPGCSKKGTTTGTQRFSQQLVKLDDGRSLVFFGKWHHLTTKDGPVGEWTGSDMGWVGACLGAICQMFLCVSLWPLGEFRRPAKLRRCEARSPSPLTCLCLGTSSGAFLWCWSCVQLEMEASLC